MVKLLDADIRTQEVRAWKGLHVFHAATSSCSQKLRIFLNMKSIPWTSHLVDLGAGENLTDFYMGINPRGLVPAIVDDGDVHIESNDIILHLESRYPDPPLVPVDSAEELAELLRHEDDLHIDLRTITFRFVVKPKVQRKSESNLVRYGATGSGTVGGKKDAYIDFEIAYWRTVNDQGITDDMVRRSVSKFQREFERLERVLESSPYLLGDRFSILDVAWIIYANRLRLAGYPLERLHPRLSQWLDTNASRPEVASEIAPPPGFLEAVTTYRSQQRALGNSLEDVCFRV